MPDNATAIRRTIDGFVCPSNRRPMTVNTGTGSHGDLAARPVRLPGQHGRRHGHPGQQQQLPDHARPDQSSTACIYDNGMMYQNSTVNMADITDGTSTTVIFGESIYPTGVWSQATSCCVRTNIDRTINKPILFNGHQLLDLLDEQAPQHGQLRLLRRQRPARDSQINKLVLNKIMTRNGGETISSDEIK